LGLTNSILKEGQHAGGGGAEWAELVGRWSG